MDMDIKQIKALAELAHDQNLAEIKVEDGDKKVTIKTVSGIVASGQTVMMAAPQQAASTPAIASQTTVASAAAAPEAKAGHIVTAPMVGTFYAAASPDAPPFVKVGDTISVGQPLCIIEAMKLMNQLESDVAGTVSEVLLQNGQPVEYGQALFRVAV
ncbi:MAG: acetyl-CoA carboxylase biotin carboxyl carrier protein [Vampirovibrionales bacterium]|nr:acetyl-CoA carboxylase biotin carboxyl carrier protein [Vampirovibrionales bacterium]